MSAVNTGFGFPFVSSHAQYQIGDTVCLPSDPFDWLQHLKVRKY